MTGKASVNVPIRVCHIITTLELGGAQLNTLYTVENLDPKQFSATLVTGPEGELHNEAREAGVSLVLLPSLGRAIHPARDLRAIFSLTRWLRRHRPQIVHTHSSKAGILGRTAASMAGVPHIVHSVHGFGFHPEQPAPVRRLFIEAERLAGRYATDAFVGVSRANLDEGRRLGLFGDAAAHLIRSGVSLGDFQPNRSRDPNKHRITVGMVACLKPQKAPLDFVAVARRVVQLAGEQDLDVRFVLVGDGELRPEVEAAVRRHDLGDRLEILGWRRDIPTQLASFDILLHTSRWEGLPRVFPEAMASGLPIVATRVDSAPEAIEDGVTGFLAEPGDVEGMADRIMRLACSSELREKFGAEAVLRVRAWDIDEMVRQQESLYLSLVGPKLTAGE